MILSFQIKQFVHRIAIKNMATVRSLVNADAKLDIMEEIAINVIHTQVAGTAIVTDRGNVIASK